MKKYAFLLIAMTAFFTFLMPRVFPAFPFEGQWTTGGTLGDSPTEWTLAYTFSSGAYSINGYPPLQESGWYTIESHTEGAAEDHFLLLMHATESNVDVPEPYLLDIVMFNDGSMTMTSFVTGSSTTFDPQE